MKGKELLDLERLFLSNDIFIFNRDLKISRSKFFRLVFKWYSFIKHHFTNEIIICSIGLEQIDEMAIFIATILQQKKWVAINPRLSKNEITVAIDQLPVKSYLSHNDLNLGGYVFKSTDATYVDSPPETLKVDPSIDCLLVFTSGSSGRPKAVVHSLLSLQASAMSTNDFYDVKKEDTWLLSLGLFHIAGIMIFVRMLFSGGSVELINSNLQSAIATKRSTLLSLVPTQIIRLIETGVDLSYLKALIIGGAKAEGFLLKKLNELSIPASISYGSSETAAQISATPIGECDGSVGKVLQGRIIKFDEHSRLSISGKALLSGYYLDRQFIDPKIDGFYYSSDLGELRGGRLFIKARNDRVFQFGGENISPDFIETQLNRHLDYDLQIIPKKDYEYGSIITLVVRSAHKPEISKIQASFQSLSSLLKPREVYWHPNFDINSKVSVEFYIKKISGEDALHPLVKL